MIDRGRLAHAFSPRRHLRALWEPKAGHLAPLDGIRALAILWTIAFHTGWYSFARLRDWRYPALLRHPLMTLAWRGHFGVDAFFVLSGFLIAGILIDERERTGRIRLGIFYARRLMRLWPALLTAIVIGSVVTGRSLGDLWPNALYVSNFVPVLQAQMASTWSLAIEEHFYLVCPWLIDAIAPLGLRGRARVLGALLVLGCVVAAWVTLAGDFHAMDTEVVINRGLLRWARGYDALYSKPWMRVGPLLVGVAAAYAHRSPGTMSRLAGSGWRGTAGLVVALLVGLFAGAWPRFAFAPRWLEVGYIATHRTLFGLCVGYALLLSISEHRAGRALGRVLSARVFHPFAQLAYAAYLLNPMVTLAVERGGGAFVDGLPPFLFFSLMFPIVLLATFAAAAIVHVLVERPLMELRPRAPDDATPTPALTPRRLGWQLAAMIGLGVLLPLALSLVIPRIAPVRRRAGAGQIDPRAQS